MKKFFSAGSVVAIILLLGGCEYYGRVRGPVVYTYPPAVVYQPVVNCGAHAYSDGRGGGYYGTLCSPVVYGPAPRYGYTPTVYNTVTTTTVVTVR